MQTRDIQIRDPFVFTSQAEKTYYLFGTTDRDCWRGPAGFDCCASSDLKTRTARWPAQTIQRFLGQRELWAPEVHQFMAGSTCLPVHRSRALSGHPDPRLGRHCQAVQPADRRANHARRG